jgi:AraC family transcriptional regulator
VEQDQAGRTSVADNFAEVALVPPILSSAGQAWNGIQVMQFQHAFRELALAPFANHIVTIYLGQPIQLVQTINGQTHEHCLTAGNVTLIPAGLSSEWIWKRSRTIDILHLYLKPAFLRQVAEATDRNPDQLEMVNRLGVDDPQIHHIGLALKAELEAGCPSGSLYAESLATAIAIRLLQTYSTANQTRSPHPQRGLTERELRTVIDYIDAHLADQLTLAALATQVRLSPCHFAYRFKQAAGLTPHQVVIQRRIDRAKQLLRNSELSLSDIADRVGFADQSHFSRHFKRCTGLTPKVFLANRKTVL